MAEHKQHIPADKKDRENFAKGWKADRDFKESEKNRRFAAINERKKNGPGAGKGARGINVEIKGN